MIAIYGGYFGGGRLPDDGRADDGRPVAAPRDVDEERARGRDERIGRRAVLTSPHLHWGKALALGGGAVVGGLLGTWALHRVNERVLRIGIVCIGAVLTVGLFVKPI